jgi:D-alanyl-D-alanine carboxypeptidase
MMHRARQDFIELSYIYGGAIFVVLLLSVIAMPVGVKKFGLVVPAQKSKEIEPIYRASAFDTATVQAKAYVVYDLVDQKVIAAKNADTRLPLASVSKIMMAITALDHHDANTKITIRPESIEDGYDLGLKKGQVWTLMELLKYTLTISSNDGAHAIADGLGGRKQFVAEMNEEATKLGLPFVFTDPAGLDVGSAIGGIGTPLDVAKLFGIAFNRYPEIFEATTRARVTVYAGNDRLTGVPNTNQDIINLFGAEASKTGFTDSAGGNLAVIVDIALGHPVAIVVLGSTHEDRFSDTETLYKALQKSIQQP